LIIFFENPYKGMRPTGQFSVLYLLRRDILICFGLNPDDNKQIEHRALWPGTMGVLAGIDLIGKFFAGEDSIGEGGHRFCKFIRENFASLSARDEEIIYQLRNSMLHSFGLYSKAKKREFRFSLTAANNPLVTVLGGDNYHIDIFTLYYDFERAVNKYENDLRKNKDLQFKFQDMIGNYGFIKIE
jgi:hypothetical protein